jgi:hypothetical protein
MWSDDLRQIRGVRSGLESMTDAPSVLAELTELIWSRLREDLSDLEPAEIDWRPLPQANSINLIVRHLRIESQWQLESLERAQPMILEASTEVKAFIDSVPLDFKRNLAEMEQFCIRFIAALRTMPIDAIEQRGCVVYHDFPGQPPPHHFLGYHHAVHLAMHWGQIRSLRNLYRTSRGEPALFFPDNPTFPTRSTC